MIAPSESKESPASKTTGWPMGAKIGAARRARGGTELVGVDETPPPQAATTSTTKRKPRRRIARRSVPAHPTPGNLSCEGPSGGRKAEEPRGVTLARRKRPSVRIGTLSDAGRALRLIGKPSFHVQAEAPARAARGGITM